MRGGVLFGGGGSNTVQNTNFRIVSEHWGESQKKYWGGGQGDTKRSGESASGDKLSCKRDEKKMR